MTHHSPLRCLVGVLLAMLLVACGADGNPSDSAAAEAGRSAGERAADSEATGSGAAVPTSVPDDTEDSDTGTGDSELDAGSADAGSGEDFASASPTGGGRPAPDPDPAPAPAPAPAPEPGPATASESGGGAPGAPYDIEAFDQIQGTKLTTLDREVAERCGSPSGATDCLVVEERPATAPQEIRDACSLTTPDYEPDADYTSGTGMLQRGTVVTVDVACPQVLEAVGGTLVDLDDQIADRCGTVDDPECISSVEDPPPAEGVDRASCTVVSLSYAPEPVEAGALGTVIDAGTVVTVEASCGTPGG